MRAALKANQRTGHLLRSPAVGTPPLTGREGPTLLAFLTTTCAPCQPFWEMMAVDLPGRDLGIPVVVVTPSPSTEDERLARRLVPAGARLHMSSETWFAYGVGQAGTFVLAAGAAGGPPVWEQPGEVLGWASLEAPSDLAPLLQAWHAKSLGP